MGSLNQDIYIPEAIYKFLPLLYAAAGLFLLLVFQNAIARLAGAALVIFALVITIKRFRKPDGNL